jgi:dolichol-phosphate mannosyltransferase
MRIGVVLPAYNEAENIATLIPAIRASVPGAAIVVVDDSPDRATADAAERLGDPAVRVIHRGAKNGRGSAVLLGMQELLADACDVIVEMDSDLSHDPEQIPELAAACTGAGMVVASRYTPGGRIVNWPLRRRIFSRFANALTRAALGVPIHDYTTGYRAYSRAAAELIVATCGNAGRGFIALSEIAVTVYYHGHSVVEVPTTFVNRTRGTSSFGVAEIAEAAAGLRRVVALKRRLLRRR